VGLSATPVQEELIVQYLLGELPEQQQVEIEDRAFQDRQYMRNVLAVEDDLIDEYVRGELTGKRRQKFETYCLASAERRRKVDFARALATVTSDEASEVAQRIRPPQPPIERHNPFAVFIRSLNPAIGFSLAVVGLVVVFGATWLIQDGMRLRSQLTQLRAEHQSEEQRRQQLEQQVANERARAAELAAQIERQRQDDATRSIPQEQQPSHTLTTMALALLPGIVRGSDSVPSVVVPPTVGVLRLQVGIHAADTYPTYQIEIRTQGGKQVWYHAKLRAHTTRTGLSISLNLPAKILQRDRYELSLRGNNTAGNAEDIGYYYFEVIKK